MTKISQVFIVFSLFLLIITGLNVCNQGLNSLTQENRKPVLSLHLNSDSDQVSVFTLGKEYNYSQSNWEQEKDKLVQRAHILITKIKTYVSEALKMLDSNAADS